MEKRSGARRRRGAPPLGKPRPRRAWAVAVLVGALAASGSVSGSAPASSPPVGRAVFLSAAVVLGVLIAGTVIFVRLRRLRDRL